VTGGWARVQAICDYVHNRIQFGYHHARCDRTASEGHLEQAGVCRDFAHLAVTLCRCMNIRHAIAQAISATLLPRPCADGFQRVVRSSWTVSGIRSMPGTNVPRIGRIVIARGRDAADVAISTHLAMPT
jgi:hypothetical protein